MFLQATHTHTHTCNIFIHIRYGFFFLRINFVYFLGRRRKKNKCPISHGFVETFREVIALYFVIVRIILYKRHLNIIINNNLLMVDTRLSSDAIKYMLILVKKNNIYNKTDHHTCSESPKKRDRYPKNVYIIIYFVHYSIHRST